VTERRARRRPGENRKRLLEAGLIEFGLFGFHGASTAGIAARAGVPQPHVYASFATKQELVLACVELSCAGVRDRAGVDVPRSLQRIVLQALSAVRDPALNDALSRELGGLRSCIGEVRFAALLSAAAAGLLDDEA
jgi:AcrR family transcriptional regulator